MTIDANGHVWLAGAAYTQSGKGKTAGWTSVATVVRLQESVSGPWTWSEHSVTPVAQGLNRAEATAITADHFGNVYVNTSLKASDTTTWMWEVKRMQP